MDAAERLEAVDLTRVIKRYVPPEQKTERTAEEMVVAKQALGTRRSRWATVAALCGGLMVCGGFAGYVTQQHMQMAAVAQRNAKPRLDLDVLNAIQGVWGFQADFLQSCQENPQTITVTPERRRVSVRYAKPYHAATNEVVLEMEFEVASATPDMLVLSGPVSSMPDKIVAATFYFQFLDGNSFILSKSDVPFGSSGTIVRCPAT